MEDEDEEEETRNWGGEEVCTVPGGDGKWVRSLKVIYPWRCRVFILALMLVREGGMQVVFVGGG